MTEERAFTILWENEKRISLYFITETENKSKKKEVYLKKKKAVVTLTRVNGMRIDFPHIAEGCKESPF